MTTVVEESQQLIRRLRSYERVVIAFSGGVDSSVVAAAAHRAEIPCIAVTATSPSVPAWQLSMAKEIATEIGITHRIVSTDEVSLDDYVRNDRRRCFYCKQTLYQALATICQSHLAASNSGSSREDVIADAVANRVIVSGTNADDLGDYRPGIEAGALANVRTPLADLGLGKSQVRALASLFGLSNQSLPASPCLASRVAYGIQVTPERLKRIEQAEEWLRTNGFTDCRVRVHENELARIEVPRDEIGRLMEFDLSRRLAAHCQAIGFRYTTVDMQGLRSGNLNQVLVSINV